MSGYESAGTGGARSPNNRERAFKRAVLRAEITKKVAESLGTDIAALAEDVIAKNFGAITLNQFNALEDALQNAGYLPAEHVKAGVGDEPFSIIRLIDAAVTWSVDHPKAP